MEALVLAGGQGTRLASVLKDTPKPMAEVNGKPFLAYVIRALAKSPIITEVILSVGHKAEQVVEYFTKNTQSLPVRFIHEASPMGTGGAILFALREGIKGAHFFALNGDTLVGMDYDGIFETHQGTEADTTMGLVRVPDTSRYGAVAVEGDRVVSCREKEVKSRPGLINAGVYLFRKAALERFPAGPCSLEKDILPVQVAEGKVCGRASDGPFIDIGIPETYRRAGAFIDEFFAK